MEAYPAQLGDKDDVFALLTVQGQQLADDGLSVALSEGFHTRACDRRDSILPRYH